MYIFSFPCLWRITAVNNYSLSSSGWSITLRGPISTLIIILRWQLFFKWNSAFLWWLRSNLSELVLFLLKKFSAFKVRIWYLLLTATRNSCWCTGCLWLRHFLQPRFAPRLYCIKPCILNILCWSIMRGNLWREGVILNCN